MSDANDRTIDGYGANIAKYISVTPQEPSHDVKAWIDASLKNVSQSAAILELGSGFGHDAMYIESMGYTVRRTDGTPGFVAWLREHGQVAEVLNVITDPLGGPYDVIFADAVLLHVNRKEMAPVLRKIYDALRAPGKLVFSLKAGDGEEWSSEKLGAPLFICYWQPNAIKALLHDTGFRQVTLDLVSGGEGKPQRMHIVALKPR